MPRHRSRSLARTLLGACAACVLSACGSTTPPPSGLAAGALPIAVLPIEDLSGQAGVGERFTRIVYTELAKSARWSVQEPGETDIALVEARIRSTAVMTREQTVLTSERLGTRWLLTGTVLEYGRIRTPDGDMPSVGLALRLLDGHSGRVVWADQQFRSGEDRETVFAWGRVNDITQLAGRMAAELVQRIRVPAAEDTSSVKRGQR